MINVDALFIAKWKANHFTQQFQYFMFSHSDLMKKTKKSNFLTLKK